MLILKHSFLDAEKDLVKVLMGGAYGIYQLSTGQITVPPVYCHIYPFSGSRAVVKKGAAFLEIDRRGNEYRDREGLEEERGWEITKADRCPDCDGGGCRTCYGLGCIYPDGVEGID